jgi:hypothetical protein
VTLDRSRGQRERVPIPALRPILPVVIPAAYGVTTARLPVKGLLSGALGLGSVVRGDPIGGNTPNREYIPGDARVGRSMTATTI